MKGPQNNLLTTLVVSTLAWATASQSHAVIATYGANLVQNGGAEEGDYTDCGEDVVTSGWEDGSISGASRAGNVNTAATVQTFGLHACQDPDTTTVLAGMTESGRSYFYGGGVKWNNDLAAELRTEPMDVAMRQTINVKNLTQGQEATYEFSAWFGGWNDSNSSGFVDARFLDDQGSELDWTRIGGIRAEDRGNSSKRWVEMVESGFIPAGTSFIQLSIWFDNPAADCSCIDTAEAGIDNISFKVQPIGVIPEPNALLLGSAGLLGIFRRRR